MGTLEESLRYYTLAMQLRPDDLPAEEVNSIRYCLAYLHYKGGDLRKAASLGEELAQRYPEHPQARQAAKIALAAQAALFNDAPSDQAPTRPANRMLAVADTITRQWEGEPEAAEAWMVPHPSRRVRRPAGPGRRVSPTHPHRCQPAGRSRIDRGPGILDGLD